MIGFLLVAYKQVIVSKKLGSSQTAVEVLNGRWTMHLFGMRKDAATAKLAKSLPNTSTTGLWLVLFPLWVKHRISGRYFIYPRVPDRGEEGIADLVVARTFYFDAITQRLARETEQFVVLGAGYDTRAYGALKKSGLKFFELDQPKTQAMKVQWLGRAGIDTSHVQFVPIDFGKDNVFDKLKEQGYDPEKKTLFLWEGVTLYLTRAHVRKMLRAISDNAVPGSALVADFYADRFVKHGMGKIGRKTLDYTNEGFGFGLLFDSDFELVLSTFVTGENLGVGETHFMGSKDKNGPFMVVAEARV